MLSLHLEVGNDSPVLVGIPHLTLLNKLFIMISTLLAEPSLGSTLQLIV